MQISLTRCVRTALVLLAIATVGDAIAQSRPLPPLPPGLVPGITITELMKNSINPSAQALWMAVSYVATEAGTTETMPTTDDDWAALRKQADTLLKASATLMLPVLKIADEQPGKTPNWQYTAAEIDQQRRQNQDAWREYAVRLQNTTQQLIGTIEKRDLDAFTDLGPAINQTCEGCHAQFWYRPQLRGPQ